MWPKFIDRLFPPENEPQMARREEHVFQVHVYQHYLDPTLADLVREFRAFKREVIAMHAELKQMLKDIDAETTRLSVELAAILEQMAGGVTADQATELLAEGNAIVERLKAIAHDPNNPIPPL